MKVEIKVAIVNQDEERFMGAGLLWLLQRIRAGNSISEAARDMDMSYAKAHRILKRLEKNLGGRVLDRRIGGCERGGADLTPLGQDFLEHYDQLQQKIKAYAEDEFSGFLSAWEARRGQNRPTDAPETHSPARPGCRDRVPSREGPGT